jgi:hypothetical protein
MSHQRLKRKERKIQMIKHIFVRLTNKEEKKSKQTNNNKKKKHTQY